MKITYVSDNRTGANWGCRATSIALAQIITDQHTLHSTIYNDIKKRPVGIKSYLPSPLARAVEVNRAASRPFRALAKFDGLLGAQYDFVTMKPEQSVANLLRHKHRLPILEEIYQNIKQADAIVINGEGDMIFNPQRRTLLFLLMIIELAWQLKVPCHFVNAMVSDCPRVGRPAQMVESCLQALRKCASIALRDPESSALVKQLAPDLQCSYIPDALFSWDHYFAPGRSMQLPYGDAVLPFSSEKDFGRYDFTKPYICLAGSSLAAVQNMQQVVQAYEALVTAMKGLGLPVYLVQPCPGDRFLKQVSKTTGVPLVPMETPILLAGTVLANARLFVSGRYHPTILASLGGTPCVCLGSNSHKMHSLQQVLNYDTIAEFGAVPDAKDINAIVELSRQKLSAGDTLRTQISRRVTVLGQEAKTVAELLKKNQPEAAHRAVAVAA